LVDQLAEVLPDAVMTDMPGEFRPPFSATPGLGNAQSKSTLSDYGLLRGPEHSEGPARAPEFSRGAAVELLSLEQSRGPGIGRCESSGSGDRPPSERAFEVGSQPAVRVGDEVGPCHALRTYVAA